MAYSSFTALDLKNKFGINQRFVEHLFDDFEPKKSSQLLQQTLKHNVSFALGQGTEKARSEFIIAPVLTELHIQTKEQISIFSGVEFNVDKKRGLSGWCDFLISRSPFQRELEAPVIVAVEAKQ